MSLPWIFVERPWLSSCLLMQYQNRPVQTFRFVLVENFSMYKQSFTFTPKLDEVKIYVTIVLCLSFIVCVVDLCKLLNSSIL
jgi:hypothetical protein